MNERLFPRKLIKKIKPYIDRKVKNTWAFLYIYGKNGYGYDNTNSKSITYYNAK